MDEYRDACFAFGHKLAAGYKGYLGAVGDTVRVFPPSEEFPEDLEVFLATHYAPSGAMELQADGFFHMNVVVILTPEHQLAPQNIVTCRILFKKVEDTFIVKIGQDGKEHRIAANDASAQDKALEALYGELFEQTKEIIELSFDNFINQRENRNPIGFSIQSQRGKISPPSSEPS